MKNLIKIVNIVVYIFFAQVYPLFLPLALAMGVSVVAGPRAGIYGAIFVGFFAALFGWFSVSVVSGIANWCIGPQGRYQVLFVERRPLR